MKELKWSISPGIESHRSGAAKSERKFEVNQKVLNLSVNVPDLSLRHSGNKEYYMRC